MKMYEIIYSYEGQEHALYKQPRKGQEEQLLQRVVNSIASLTRAGAVIISLKEIAMEGQRRVQEDDRKEKGGYEA